MSEVQLVMNSRIARNHPALSLGPWAFNRCISIDMTKFNVLELYFRKRSLKNFLHKYESAYTAIVIDTRRAYVTPSYDKLSTYYSAIIHQMKQFKEAQQMAALVSAVNDTTNNQDDNDTANNNHDDNHDDNDTANHGDNDATGNNDNDNETTTSPTTMTQRPTTTTNGKRRMYTFQIGLTCNWQRQS
jgi:hypothetical protein